MAVEVDVGLHRVERQELRALQDAQRRRIDAGGVLVDVVGPVEAVEHDLAQGEAALPAEQPFGVALGIDALRLVDVLPARVPCPVEGRQKAALCLAKREGRGLAVRRGGADRRMGVNGVADRLDERDAHGRARRTTGRRRSRTRTLLPAPYALPVPGPPAGGANFVKTTLHNSRQPYCTVSALFKRSPMCLYGSSATVTFVP